MEETSRGKDRISELPNDIKQHIMSSLCMRDAVATSYLSPVWRCLTRLDIEDCPNLSQIELNASKMDFFRYYTTLNHNIITLLSKCQFVRTSLILQRPRGALFNPILWYSKLVAFLANFSQSTHLDIETNSKKVVIIPQELRERFCPPLSGVQNLTFILATSSMVHDVLNYADALLWFSPHPKTISFCEEDLEPALSLELQYEDRMTELESCVCCRAHPTSCWRRVLKDFKIVYHRGLANCDSIRKLLEHELKKRKATATAGELYYLTTLNT
ncbi:uncharacterized protein LOC141597163 isoform X2 [Silene latifolia]|uniref:uncharacterized protein LOC141597163 isoform X2 n=1 Tax=Silene latifolia TaxID=37657 RepID=UPI003D76B915